MSIRFRENYPIYSVAIVSLIACGCKPSVQSVPTSAPLPKSISQIDETLPVPTNFILNPDTSRALGYPSEISVRTAEDFVVGKSHFVQGCGGMEWEGNGCGMHENHYGVQSIPWIERNVAISYTYAQTKTGTFLAEIMLGYNYYRRPDRNSDVLVWDCNVEPELQVQHAYRILAHGDSVERKSLLTKFKHSLAGVDVKRFSLQKRMVLESLLKNCLTDEDVEVVSMASSIRVLLAIESP